jgi:4-aminobutyrate aminotransferase/(S)-3-amino-2-methylpropionate transaminase
MSYWPVYKFMNLRKVLNPNQTAKVSDTYHKLVSALIEPYEAPNPKVLTAFPGPKAIELSQTMSNILYNKDKEIINTEKSFGNYFTDVDGNVVLDMTMDNGRNILGYNSRRLLREARWQKYAKFAIQRPAIGAKPPQEYPKLVFQIMNKLAPPGLNEVYFTCGCYTSANENALKLAYLNKFYELKGSSKITPEEEKTVYSGHMPGAPDFAIIGLEGGHHGSSLSTMSASNCEHIKPNQFIRFNWPIAPFPDIKYPYEENEIENRKEEERCIAQTEQIIKDTLKYKPIAGMIVEPIQEGVRYASSQFYKDLIDLSYQYNFAFICDETNTCGWVDGRPFMHKRWVADKPVHMVTFGNRMQLAGLFYQNQFRPKYPYQVFSTWNGDAIKLQQVNDIIHQLGKEWMDNHGATFWQGIKGELLDLQRRWQVPINNIRGIGKIFAFDLEHSRVRDEIVEASRQNGFKVGKAGTKSIVFTPSLMFTEVHFAKYKNWLLNLQTTTHRMGSFSH